MSNEAKRNAHNLVVEKFKLGLPSRLSKMKTALILGNFASLQEESHKLINSQLFGFPELTVVSRELEIASRREKHEDCKKLLLKMSNLIDEINLEEKRLQS